MGWHWPVVIGLLKDKPHIVGAEIGVFRGVFAKQILSSLPGIQTYFCVDPWIYYDDYTDILRSTSHAFKIKPDHAYQIFLRNTEPWRDKVVVLRDMSMNALKHVQDGSLDWVFVDGNHAYKYAREDIVEWSKKVKVGGLISGHDFRDSAPRARKVPFGVGRAVKELVPEFEVKSNVWYTWKKTEQWIGSV